MLGKKKPVNTAEQAKSDTLMSGWIMGGAPEKIVAQEKAGQSSFVDSTTLPKVTNNYGYDTVAILKKAGVKFLGAVEGDPLFQYVELPPGWKKVPTDDSMWSKVVDEKGRQRVRIFYKAAFYDRDAFMSASGRYSYQFDYERFKQTQIGVAHVTDCGKQIYTTEAID